RRSAVAAARTRGAAARLLEFVASYVAPTRGPLARRGDRGARLFTTIRVLAAPRDELRRRVVQVERPGGLNPGLPALPKCSGIGAPVRRNRCPSAPASLPRRPRTLRP